MNARQINNALRFLPTSPVVTAARSAAPIVAGALLLIGCSASSGDAGTAGETDAEDDRTEQEILEAEAQALIDEGLECEIFEGGYGCVHPDVELLDPFDPPADRTPAAIPDGVYRGEIDRSEYDDFRVEPLAKPSFVAGPSEMVVEIVDGEIVELTASTSTSHDYAEAPGEGWSLCGVDRTDHFVGDPSSAWIDGASFRSRTSASSTGTADCGTGELEPVSDFWFDPDVAGTYADGVIHAEFHMGWNPEGISAVLVAD